MILEIELDGAQQVKRIHPDAVLDPHRGALTADEQAARLRRRGDDEASVARRLEVGEAEERLGRRLAEHVVVNDDIDRAAREVAGILEDTKPAADGAARGTNLSSPAASQPPSPE